MRNALGLGMLLAFASAYCVAAIAWIAAISCLFGTMANRRPGVRLWNATLGYFPPNIIFRPDLLTDRGRLHRRRCAIAILTFLGALGAALALERLLSLLG